MTLIEFLIKAKTSTYASGPKYKVPSTKPNSIDYHYEEDNYIYHDTYFGSKEFYGEEIVSSTINSLGPLNGSLLSTFFNAGFNTLA